MRTLTLWTAAALLLGGAAQPASAANKGNSIAFLRTMTRQASTEVDAAYFNPAGLAFLEHQGLSFELTNQFIYIKDIIEDSGELLQNFHPSKYEATIKTYLYPIAHLAYHRGDWAAFASFYPIAGGAGGRFPDGFPSVDGGFLNMLESEFKSKITEYSRKLTFEAVDYALAGSVGGAFRVKPWLSVALGYRLTRKIATYNGEMSEIHIATAGMVWDEMFPGTMDIESEATGWCHGLIAGVHAQPTKKLNIGLKLEYSTTLEVTTKNKKFQLAEPGMNPEDPGVREFFKKFLDGYTEKVTEPPSIAFGVSYQLLPPLRMEVGVWYQFNAWVDAGGKEKDHFGAPWVGLGLEYAFTPTFLASVGYGYDQSGRKPSGQSDTNMWLSGHYMSAGFSYRVIPALAISLGASYSIGVQARSTTASPDDGVMTFNNGSFVFGVGVNGWL